MAESRNAIHGPGLYINKRGESIRLAPYSDMNMYIDDQGRYYMPSGACMFWSTLNERFLMNTDPKTDLVVAGRSCPQHRK